MTDFIFAGDQLIYDSRIPDDVYPRPMSAEIKETLNRGGSAELVLPPGHPDRERFRPYQTEIRILRDSRLRWRGRVLGPPADDLYGRRTVLCEGELCFFNDTIQLPFTFQGSPAELLSKVVTAHNAMTDPWKHFAVGSVTIDDEVLLELKKAEKSYKTLQRMVKQCGGYLIFDSDPDGNRRINWYAQLPYLSSQSIRFGQNLLDFKTKSDVSHFATRLIPFGAKQEDGSRLQLQEGFVEDADAVKRCGVIADCVYYDDITDADVLRRTALADLRERTSLPVILQVSALDLSRYENQLNDLQIGQRIPVESYPHGVSGTYDLISCTENLMDPDAGEITLAKSIDRLTEPDGTLSGLQSNAERNTIHYIQILDDSMTQDELVSRLNGANLNEGLYVKDGHLYFNGSCIRTGSLMADLLKLLGRFEVYSGEHLGGYLGYLAGITDEGQTDGIGLSSADEGRTNYVVVTTKGVALRADNALMYLIPGQIGEDGIQQPGQLHIKGELYVEGQIHQNAQLSNL